MNTKKRLCLFAGFSKHQKIENYVINCIRHLQKFADIYYCADNDLNETEIKKLIPVTKAIYFGKHHTYDFGSWAKIIDHLGWDFIEQYDELLLINDSCFGPFYDLDGIFQKMDCIDCDAWGLAKNHFLMSFFLCIKRIVFFDTEFRSFFKTLIPSQDKGYFLKCEKRLNALLQKYRTAAFLDKKDLKILYKQHRKQIRQALRKNIPFHVRLIMPLRLKKVRLYDNQALILPFIGFPFIKKNAFYNLSSVIPIFGIKFIEDHFQYSSEYIKDVIEPSFLQKAHTKQYIVSRIKNIVQQNKAHLFKQKKRG